MLDGDLHAFEGGGAHRLFYFGEHMLKNSLVDSLLDDLKDTVFYNQVAVDEIRARGCYFGDECIGSKHIPDHVRGTINEGATDDMESCKECGIAISNVGKRYGVIVTPGREGGWELHGGGDR